MNHTNSSLLYLKNENPVNQFLLYLAVFLLDMGGLIYLVYYFTTNPAKLGTFFLVPVILGFSLIFFGLLAFNEYRGRSDFIHLTKSTLKYQHSPKFFYTGIISRRGAIVYSDIACIRVIQIRTGLDVVDEKIKKAQFNPEAFFQNKKLVLEVVLNDGATAKMGERLPPGGLVQLAVLIEGRAKLGSIYAKFQENFPNLATGFSEALGRIKNIFRKD